MEDLGKLRQREDEVRDQLEKVRARLASCVATTRELSRLEERVSTVDAGVYRTDASVLADKVANARAARAERALLRTAEASLMMDLEDIRARLEKRGIRHVALPMLDDVRVAAPCEVPWSSMDGDSDVRYCGSCKKHVYNLSMMSRAEAEAVLVAAKATEGACIRLYRRVDGTVITDDCPVGERRRRFWRRTGGIAAAGLLAAALGSLLYSQMTCQVHVQGTSAASGGME
jgi:hypothetical protein